MVTPIIPELEEAKVAGLIKTGQSAEWDVDILDDLFDPRDKDRILKTPISPGYKDDWYWRFHLKGVYTVKSAYKALVMRPNWNNNMDISNWTRLWKLKVPEKVKLLWWRIARGIVPVHDTLRKRGVDLDYSYPLCANHPETIEHLFFECVKT